MKRKEEKGSEGGFLAVRETCGCPLKQLTIQQKKHRYGKCEHRCAREDPDKERIGAF